MGAVKNFSEFINESLNKKGTQIVPNSEEDDLFLQSAREGDIGSCKYLLDKRGASINAQDDYAGQTALYHAADRWKDDVVEFLVARGADPNIREWEYDETPLSIAVVTGNEKAIDLILGSGKCSKETLHGAMESAFVHGYRQEVVKLMKHAFDRGINPLFIDDAGVLVNFFNGDLSWAPDDFKEKIKRMQRGKQAFGM